MKRGTKIWRALKLRLLGWSAIAFKGPRLLTLLGNWNVCYCNAYQKMLAANTVHEDRLSGRNSASCVGRDAAEASAISKCFKEMGTPLGVRDMCRHAQMAEAMSGLCMVEMLEKVFL